MAFMIALILTEATMIVLLFPIKLSVTAHFSLSNEIANVQIKFAGISLIRLKALLSDGLKVQINGKELKCKKKTSAIAKQKLAAFVLKNKILSAQDLIAYVGASDAKNSAILCAVLQMLPIFAKTVIKDAGKDRFDAECGVTVRINAMQIAQSIAISRG